jgi:transcriptional regulator with XRE-family HTH domain
VEPKQLLGAKLRRFREAAGLTQEQLGFRCNLDLSEISRIERGERDIRLSTVVRLATGLGLDPGEFVSGIGPTAAQSRAVRAYALAAAVGKRGRK